QLGALRLAPADRRPGDAARRDLGRAPDGADPLDGVGDGAAVHRSRPHRLRHDPCRRPVLRRGAARMKSDRGWTPGPVDLDWIEAAGRPPHPVLIRMEEEAEPEGIPIL